MGHLLQFYWILTLLLGYLYRYASLLTAANELRQQQMTVSSDYHESAESIDLHPGYSLLGLTS